MPTDVTRLPSFILRKRNQENWSWRILAETTTQMNSKPSACDDNCVWYVLESYVMIMTANVTSLFALAF